MVLNLCRVMEPLRNLFGIWWHLHLRTTLVLPHLASVVLNWDKQQQPLGSGTVWHQGMGVTVGCLFLLSPAAKFRAVGGGRGRMLIH